MSERAKGYDSLFVQRVEAADQHPLVWYIAELCIQKNVPIVYVAEQVGVTRATVYNWMLGKSMPRERHLEQMPKVISKLRKRRA